MQKQTVSIIVTIVNYNTENEIQIYINNLNSIFENIGYKLIVVNNYSNDESLKMIKSLSQKLDFILIESENEGFGYGHNKAIEYASENYNFDFLIVSNSDIIIKSFPIEVLKKYNRSIVGPKIITPNKKMMNPAILKRHQLIISKYFGFLSAKYNMKILYYIFLTTIKILKKIQHTTSNNVYAVNGAFIIFSSFSIKQLSPIFENEIFLLNEELVLAEKAYKKHIKIVYEDSIDIFHSVGVSLKKFDRERYFKWWRNSFLTFYNKYLI